MMTPLIWEVVELCGWENALSSQHARLSTEELPKDDFSENMAGKEEKGQIVKEMPCCAKGVPFCPRERWKPRKDFGQWMAYLEFTFRRMLE